MTPRERHAPAGAAPGPAPGRSSAAVPSAPSAPLSSLWEDWYLRASPAQRQALLALAGHQGILYAPQLPPPEHASAARPLLPAFLNGQTRDLESLSPPPLEPFDTELDAAQREAIARALHTPDVCLIQGLPGTGKSRVVAEIVSQAASRGQRVLLLAATTSAIDCVLERLASCEVVCPVRCVGPDETLDALAPCIRRLTLAERQRSFEHEALPAAHEAVRASRQVCVQLEQQAPLWTRLEEVLAHCTLLAPRMQALQEKRARIDAEVEAELEAALREAAPSSLQAQWKACATERDEALARIDARLAELRAETDKVRGEHQEAESELQHLHPLVEARQERRWWTGAWWRTLFQSNLLTQAEGLRQRLEELQAAAAALERELGERSAEREQVEERCRSERRRLADEETGRRQGQLDAEAATLTAELRQREEAWQTLAGELGVKPEPTADGLRSCRSTWEEQRARAGERLACAEEWSRVLEEMRPELPARLAHWANVVAATTSTLASDAVFGERGGLAAFDLLVLEEADEATESELMNAARRARRWVLVGAPAHEAEVPAGRKSGHSLRPSGLRPGVFQRLWHNLHADPRRLPYAWTEHEGSLTCSLRPLTAEQEGWLESEHVADRPEIELRIVSPPRQTPRLAQIVFPATTPIEVAKTYVYRELEELAVQPGGPRLRWEESSDRIVLELGPAPALETVSIELEAGLREVVAPRRHAGEGEGTVSWVTCALHFEKAAGWTCERARRWIDEHLPLRDLGRTALLIAAHRQSPSLAGVVSDLLLAGTRQAAGLLCPAQATSGDAPESGAGLEFVAVPSSGALLESRHPSEAEPRWAGGGLATAPRLRTVRGGAGLEIDLADTSHPQQLPTDIRSALPAQGLVNYLEARAVVHQLERLVSDPAFQQASARWQQKWAACERAGGGCATAGAARAPRYHGPTVAVMALYPAQVELLRLLVQRSSILPASPIAIEVGLPEAFQQRECLTALLSLTRSHSHRAVPYGEGPRTLTQALTRPRSSLFLFGDPGTLMRRGQWQGALDHLDESQAHQERGLVNQLVAYLQGHGPHARAFRLLESSTV